MRKLKSKPLPVRLLEDYKYLRLSDMAKLTGKPESYLSAQIHQARKGGWQIRTTPHGYSMRSKPEHWAYEMKLRCKNASGNIINADVLIQNCLQHKNEEVKVLMLSDMLRDIGTTVSSISNTMSNSNSSFQLTEQKG